MAAAPSSPTGRRLTLLVRSECPLCAEMHEALAPWAAAAGYAVDEVDLATDPALAARWGEDIPVLLAGKHEICRHRLDPAALAAFFAAAS